MAVRNRYLNELKNRHERDHEDDGDEFEPAPAPTADFMPAPSPAVIEPERGLGSIDLRGVTWIPIVDTTIGRGTTGLRVSADRISLPRDPFAAMAATWLRFGEVKDRPDLLVLAVSLEPIPGALKRHKGEAQWGGRSLLAMLAARGWTKGEYELVEKTNCWVVTKTRIR